MQFPSPSLGESAQEALEAQITELWGHINAANFRFLELLGQFDRTQGWARHGLANCAQWLNWQCGISTGTAREKVRVARALASLPQIREAFRQGRVSYSKVRAMTRAATPENEATLLNIALHGTASHVERTVGKFKRVQRDLECREANAVHRSRSVRWWYEDDGSWCLRARLSPEVGEVVKQALEAAMAVEEAGGEEAEAEKDAKKNAENNAGAEGVTENSEVKAVAETQTKPLKEAVDGVAVNGGAIDKVAVGGRALDAVEVGGDSVSEDAIGGAPVTGAEVAENGGAWTARVAAAATTATLDVSAETPPDDPSLEVRRADALRHVAEQFLAHHTDTAGSSAERYQVVVHIGEEALREAGEAYGGAELESGRHLAVETARRLGCGGSLVGLVDGHDGEPLSVGRKTRAVSTAIQRALRTRDGGCRFPGCDRNRFTQAHHIRHWADGGETSLGNLVTLCHLHHHLVHEGGYGVQAADGEIQFTRPDGRTIPTSGWDASWNNGWREKCFRGNIRVASSAEPSELPLSEYNRRRGVDIDAKTARCGWRGEVMDYGIAIESLCWESGLRL